MRLSAGEVANGLAWAVLVALAALSVLIAVRLGAVGLIVVGLLTAIVCVLAELDEDGPTWGAEVFRARMAQRRAPEEHAARQEHRRVFQTPLRLYRRYGLFIAAVGIAWFAWGLLGVGPGG